MSGLEDEVAAREQEAVERQRRMAAQREAEAAERAVLVREFIDLCSKRGVPPQPCVLVQHELGSNWVSYNFVRVCTFKGWRVGADVSSDRVQMEYWVVAEDGSLWQSVTVRGAAKVDRKLTRLSGEGYLMVGSELAVPHPPHLRTGMVDFFRPAR